MKSDIEASAMNSQDSTDSLNTTFLRPSFFVVNGLHNLPHGKYYYGFLCLVFVVSVVGNSFVMFIIYKENSFHTPKYMAVFHLAVVDIGESTFVIPNVIAVLLFDIQLIPFDACLANMFFAYFSSNLTNLTLLVMAYDRLVAICFPLRYHAIITIPAMAVMLAVMWVYSAFLFILTVALLTRLSFCKSFVIESYLCDYEPVVQSACNDYSANRIMSFVDMVSLLYLPFILTMLSYVFIAVAVFKIASWEGRRKAFKTCSAHLMMVVSRYLPLLGTYIVDMTLTLPAQARIVNISLICAITPMINPIIYVLNTEEVKKCSQRLLKIKVATTEMN